MDSAAKDVIQSLMRMGWSQKRIASEADVAESTVSRALNDPGWAIGTRLVESLRQLEISARRDLLKAVLGPHQISVVEACHSGHTPLTEKVRTQAAEALFSLLVNEVAGERLPVVWPAGTEGFLASVGGPNSGLYLIAVDPNLDEEGARVLAHELRHVADRIRAQALKTSIAEYLPEGAY